MAESQDFELFTGPAPSEKREMSDEQFREEMQKAQQALAQLQKEEGQAKANDQRLAAIIVQFLGQPGNTDLFLLISRAVAQNLPSEFIIAILSLIDKKAHDEVLALLGGAPSSMPEEYHHNEAEGFSGLSPAQKQAIDGWVANMSEVAAKKPHHTLETLIIPGPDRQIAPAPLQLSAFILRNYLAGQNVHLEFQNLRDFMEGVFVEIVKRLEHLIEGQKRLT